MLYSKSGTQIKPSLRDRSAKGISPLAPSDSEQQKVDPGNQSPNT